MKYGFIGAGNMGEAILAGLLQSGEVTPDEVCASDRSPERLEHLHTRFRVKTSTDNLFAVERADVVVLAIKPQVFPQVWPALAAALSPGVLVVSVMAGIPARRIEGDRSIRVVRVMPNTPALIGAGAAAIAAGTFASAADLRIAHRLMQAVGTVVEVDEADLDAVTALSGSGPAYVFVLLEGMLIAAERMGLAPDTARTLALATLSGAADLMRTTGESAEALREKVTSPHGTTAAALAVLTERGMKAAVIDALLTAQTRSRMLAKESEDGI